MDAQVVTRSVAFVSVTASEDEWEMYLADTGKLVAAIRRALATLHENGRAKTKGKKKVRGGLAKAARAAAKKVMWMTGESKLAQCPQCAQMVKARGLKLHIRRAHRVATVDGVG